MPSLNIQASQLDQDKSTLVILASYSSSYSFQSKVSKSRYDAQSFPQNRTDLFHKWYDLLLCKNGNLASWGSNIWGYWECPPKDNSWKDCPCSKSPCHKEIREDNRIPPSRCKSRLNIQWKSRGSCTSDRWFSLIWRFFSSQLRYPCRWSTSKGRLRFWKLIRQSEWIKLWPQ